MKNRLVSTLKRLKQQLARLAKSQPLTLRGFFAIVAGLMLLKYLALEESDLIASILGGSALGITAILAPPVHSKKVRPQKTDSFRGEL